MDRAHKLAICWLVRRDYGYVASKTKSAALRASAQASLWAALSSVGVTGCAGHVGLNPRTMLIRGNANIASSLPLHQSEYVVSEQSGRLSKGLEPDAVDGGGCTLAAGIRVNQAGELATDIAEPPLLGGVRIPQRLGGGFLFWSRSALYHTPSALAALSPMAAFRAQYGRWRTSFGPNYLLLHVGDQGSVAWSLPERKRIPLPHPGLLDVAALADGSAAMLVEPGQLITRKAGSSEWLAPEPSGSAMGAGALRVDADGIWYLAPDGLPLSRLGPEGRFVEQSAPPGRIFPDRETSGISVSIPRSQPKAATIEDAIQGGLPIGQDQALVLRDGALLQIDSRSGKVRGNPKPLVANPRDCLLAPTANDAIAICRIGSNGIAVIGRLLTDKPTTEIVFENGSPLFAGSNGVYLKAGPCHRSTSDSQMAVCRRNELGDWQQVVVPPADGDSPEANAARAQDSDAKATRAQDSDAKATRAQVNPGNVVYWLSGPKGVVAALVGGTTPGIFYPATGQLREFRDKAFPSQLRLSPPKKGLLHDTLALLEDDTVVGYSQNNAVRLWPDGHVDISPHVFTKLHSNGGVALAVSRINSTTVYWQSKDYGQIWQAVSPPPGPAERQSDDLKGCSRLGCDFGAFYRIGYPEVMATPAKFTIAPSPAFDSLPPAPAIACTVNQPAKMRALVPYDGVALEFGAKLARHVEEQPDVIQLNESLGNSGIVIATVRMTVAQPDEETRDTGRWLSQRVRLRYRQLLGMPSVVESVRPWSDWAVAKAASGIAPAGFDGSRQLPVLSPTAGRDAGMLLVADQHILWLRHSQSPLRLGLDGPYSDDTVESASSPTENELLLLTTAREGSKRIVRLTPSGCQLMVAYPARGSLWAEAPNPSSIAISRDGKAAWLRIPTFDAPTEAEPALLLMANGNVVRLAPWASLNIQESCDAGPNAHRAIVAFGSEWIDLSVAGAAAMKGNRGIAMVNWGEKNLCLEAVESPHAALNTANTSYEGTLSVTANFIAKPWAFRHSIAVGFEYTEPLICEQVKR